MNKAKILRDKLRDVELLSVAGAHDGLTAKLVEKNGFDAVWASGLEISASHGVPDANILTMSQYLERACEMNEAVNIPVIADCDTGYGNINNAMHMVKKYESAGIAAICIEDKKFPKTNSLLDGGRQELASISEFVGKVKAAKNTQRSKSFMIFARVEALIAGWGQEEALKRADAYVDAGADAILIHSKKPEADEIREFVRLWGNKAPLIIVPTKYPALSRAEAADLGIKIVIYANHGLRAQIKALESVFSEIRETGSTASIENKIAGLQEVFDLQDTSVMSENEKKYLQFSNPDVIAVIPAAGHQAQACQISPKMSDIPIAMININGKSLLQRQAEVLRRNGVREICVVGGYKKEVIDTQGIKLFHNNEYLHTGILHSIMCAWDNLDAAALVVYGDVLFDDIVLKRLLQSREDITILVDATFNSKNYNEDKVIDLVVSDNEPVKSRRRLQGRAMSCVKKIGRNLPVDEAHYEFPGLMYLSVNGSKKFKEVYNEAKKEYKTRPFHTAACFEKASLADMIQEIIDRGYQVHCLEANSGWLEVHSKENYELACSFTK